MSDSFEETTPVHPISIRSGEHPAAGPPFAPASALDLLEQRKSAFARTVLGTVAWIGGREDLSYRNESIRYPTKIRSGDGTKIELVDSAIIEMCAQADQNGFQYSGALHFGITPGGLEADVFVARDEIAYMLRPHRRTSDPLVRSRAKYAIYTFFDDGSCVETHASDETPIKAGPQAIELFGTNDFPTDWMNHVKKVQEVCAARNLHILRVPDHATVLRLQRQYVRHLTSREHLKQLMIFAGIVLACVIAGLFILEWVIQQI